MRKMIIFFAIALCLTSCTAVKFEAPQPSAAMELETFPTRMLGTYVSNDNDTLRIHLQSFRYTNGIDVNIEGQLSSSEVVLKKLNNTYLLNLKNEDSWDVFPLKLSRNRITAHFAGLDSHSKNLIQNLKRTSPVKEVRTTQGKFDHYLIAPSNKEFKRLLRKKLFSEKAEFRKLKKA